MKTNLIVVGIDGSNAASRAIAWAADEAARKGVGLLIAHATDATPPAALTPANGAAVLHESHRSGAKLLADALDDVLRKHPGLPATTVLRDQRPAEMLLGLGQSGELLVVGTHGDGRLAGALLGSVSQRVAAHAQCPVVVISEASSVMSDRRQVVVGVSTSPRGLQAMRFAFQEASERDATLVAVRAYGIFGRSAHAQIFGPLLGLRHAEDQVLQDTVASMQTEFPEVRTELRLIEEPVYDALPRAASEADLLVVGCHHEDAHWPSRLGPVASLLLHRSPCPIAIVGLAHALTHAAG